MGSISVGELITYLKEMPQNYEVVMEIKTKYVVQPGTSIAYINGCNVDKERREVRLMN